MMDMLFYGALALFVVFMLYRMLAPIRGLNELSAEAFTQAMPEAYVVDVREEQEFKRGHIRGAVNMPLSRLNTYTADMPRDRMILLYCQSGMRSKQAARQLSRSGIQTMGHLRGGITAWQGPIQQGK